MNYSDKLKSPKWQKRRLEILSLHGFKCEKCGCEDKELHVHHRFYLKGREVWEYDNDVFQVLCIDCHEKEHKKSTKTSSAIPEDYINIIQLIKCLDERNHSNLTYLELLLETVVTDEISIDETYSFIDLVKSYCNIEFGVVLKYMIRNYIFREENEASMWEEINRMKEELRKLKTT